MPQLYLRKVVEGVLVTTRYIRDQVRLFHGATSRKLGVEKQFSAFMRWLAKFLKEKKLRNV